jgi:heme A synthase
MDVRRSRLSVFAGFVLVFNLGVVLWGAFVRATGSGAGCGKHWPLCDGVVIPRSMQTATIIELTHRASSGVAMLLVLALVVLAWRTFPRGHHIRKSTGFTALFMLMEALIGASLVLKEWVAQDTSVVRAVMSAVHLGNTYFLLGALTLSTWWIYNPRQNLASRKDRFQIAVLISLAAAVLLGMTGAITALGDTLFPARSLIKGFYDDLNPASHFLIRLRAVHPMFAVLLSAYLLVLARYFKARPSGADSCWIATALSSLVVAQLILGTVNLILLAPVSTQLIHLLLADLIWIVLVLLAEASFFSRTGLTASAEA